LIDFVLAADGGQWTADVFFTERWPSWWFDFAHHPEPVEGLKSPAKAGRDKQLQTFDFTND